MAKARYQDRIGVSEYEATYEEGLRLIGKQDESGRTIAIAYFRGLTLRVVPVLLKVLFFVFLMALLFAREPFSWLPVDGVVPDWYRAIREWDAFTWTSWLAAMVIYLAYVVVSTVKASLFPGLPGAEIHFARYRKIVKTIRAGERALIFDWRVAPFAVVSSKPIAVEMPPVEGITRDNISLTFRGALILRVADSYRLLVEGGLEKFVEQLKRSYESILKDLIIGVEAKDFNRFLIEPVATSQEHKEDVSKKLELLGRTDLTIEFLNELTEIDEVDVAGFELGEPEHPRRREVIDGLRGLAETYGIEIVDHLPLGNSTSDAYLRSLALPLANSITRIEQSTDTLKEITEEEIGEEILANVADKQIGVLEVQKIIKEIESITATLRDRNNERSIVESKQIAMENTLQTILAPQRTEIESLIAQVEARVIDTAGLERYIAEVEELLEWIEAEIPNLAPQIDEMVLESLDGKGFLPEVDVIERMLETSGTERAFAGLRRQAERTEDYASMEEELLDLERRAGEIRVEDAIGRIQEALNGVTTSSGIDTEEYSAENVRRKMDEIARKAEVEV